LASLAAIPGGGMARDCYGVLFAFGRELLFYPSWIIAMLSWKGIRR